MGIFLLVIAYIESHTTIQRERGREPEVAKWGGRSSHHVETAGAQLLDFERCALWVD